MDDIIYIKKDNMIPLFMQIPQQFKNEHARLCWHGVKWLCSIKNCSMSLTEVGSGLIGEMPDVVGWSPGGYCILIECKSSRSDFLADKKKPHRADGIGDFRYFMTPDNLIDKDELPEGWGLLYLNKNGTHIKVEKEATKRVSNIESEKAILLSCLKYPDKLKTKARYFSQKEDE